MIEQAITTQTAYDLIRAGECIIHIRIWQGPYFLCAIKYDPPSQESLREIPSWTWIKEERAFKIHYLDMPILEARALHIGYSVRYGDGVIDSFMALKIGYTDRKEWKTKQLVNVPAFRPLRNYQTLGAQFMFRAKKVLNADGMGCISGDAKIVINRGGGAKTYKLKDAYHRFHNTWDKTIPSMTRSLDGDRFKLNTILNIIEKGERPVLRVVMESGKEIVATPDHVFITPSGEFPLEKLAIGSVLITNGTPVCSSCGRPGPVSQRKFKGVCKECVYRKFRKNGSGVGEIVDKDGYIRVVAGLSYHPDERTHGIYKHRLIVEAGLNGVSYEDYMLLLGSGKINGLIFLRKHDVIHHINGVKTDNRIENLSVLSKKAHATGHGDDNALNLWNVAPKIDRIKSITPAGTEMVYDVMMDGPCHTFIVNGILVHNSGKSAQAIGAVILNKMDGNPYKTLIICPSSVKSSWYTEVLAVTGELFPEILHSNMTKRYDQYQAGVGKKDVLIASYDTFIRDYADITEYFKPDILIIDEAHRLSNRQNKITQILIGGKTIKKTFGQIADMHSIYLLTGTPISNKLEDLYAMLKLIDPGIFSWTGFCNRYTIQEEVQRWIFSGGVKRAMTYFNVTGYRNEKELKGKLGLHMIRRTKEEVLPELPDKVYKTLEIELDTEERKIYNDLRKDFKAEIRGKQISIATKLEFMTRAQQICNSLETLPGAPGKKSSKLEEFLKVVNEQTKNHKIIVFSKYKTMTHIICRELKHLKPMHLNGDVPSEDRAKMIKKFQEDDKCRLFVSTFGAGGVGITLTAADVVILYDMAFTPAANSQAVDRAHRIGQHSSVNVVVMKVKDSIEERIYEINMDKQGIIDGMISDEKSVLARMPQEKLENLI
jgi:superfamily II DNA or RNA helicase